MGGGYALAFGAQPDLIISWYYDAKNGWYRNMSGQAFQKNELPLISL